MQPTTSSASPSSTTTTASAGSRTPLAAQMEKPNHYSYLKEFRVEQCPLFIQHKCTQHRPYTCFHWHFMNQRRRRPIRKRDGTFNYSPETYCTKYDETSGICPDGDDCPNLHRISGDAERRYHLKFYKTIMCVHDTDSRGLCVKNGAHCAFAHGEHDLRHPVPDIKEIEKVSLQVAVQTALNNCDLTKEVTTTSALEIESNPIMDNPKWQNTTYVYMFYKTEQCRVPPRLCRQGYACPLYHNTRDRRRSPQLFKYKSTPCPNVKTREEWGPPTNCSNGDECIYTHTRTEQQFHSDIYKSSKCNDVQQTGYCPRGVFCAFAHVDEELVNCRALRVGLENGRNLVDILADSLNNAIYLEDGEYAFKCQSESGDASGELSECDSSSSSFGSGGVFNTSSNSKTPGTPVVGSSGIIQSITFNNSKQQQQEEEELAAVLEEEKSKKTKTEGTSILGTSLSYLSAVTNNDNCNGYNSDSNEYNTSNTNNNDDSISSNANTNDSSVVSKDSNDCIDTIAAAIVNGESTNLEPENIIKNTNSNCIQGVEIDQDDVLFHNHFDSLQSAIVGNMLGNLHFDDSLTRAFQNLQNNSYHNPIGTPSSSVAANCTVNSVGGGGGGLYDSIVSNMASSQSNNSFNISNNYNNNSRNDYQNLYQANEIKNLEERLSEARNVCELWQKEVEELNKKAFIAERQRDEALAQVQALRKEMNLLHNSESIVHRIRNSSELRNASVNTLKTLHMQLQSDLQELEKVLILKCSRKCGVCNKHSPNLNQACEHLLVCQSCSTLNCPYCTQISIVENNMS